MDILVSLCGLDNPVLEKTSWHKGGSGTETLELSVRSLLIRLLWTAQQFIKQSMLHKHSLKKNAFLPMISYQNDLSF